MAAEPSRGPYRRAAAIPACPRTASVTGNIRRAATELGVFLELDAPGGGHDPAVLHGEHMRRFVADQRHREREALPSPAITKPGGKPGMVTVTTRSVVFNAARKLLREAMDTGAAERLGLDREFITAIPYAGGTVGRTARRPFPDEVAHALADEANLSRLAGTYDPLDCGMRDIWEITVTTGRRIGEVLKVRWDRIGRYGGLAMFWHDQAKVGNYDAAIRIPERIYQVIERRQAKTLDRFAARHGHRPAGAERARLALFPSAYRNPDGTVSVTHQWFCSRFRPWAGDLDLGRCVPHQARHTLATSLLRHSANSGTPWPSAPPTRPPPPGCTRCSRPPPPRSTGWKPRWPARAARRRPCPGPAPPPGLFPAGLEHRVPRHPARQHHRRHRPCPR